MSFARRYVNAFILLISTFGIGFAFQNCARVTYKIAAGSLENKPLGCVNNAGVLQNRVLTITGPSSLQVSQLGDFHVGDIDDCENVTSVTWTAGDGTPAVSNVGFDFPHTYSWPGIYTVRSDVVDLDADLYRVFHPVAVQSNCPATGSCDGQIKDVFIKGPAVGYAGNSYSFDLVIPNGLTVQSTDWDFKDSTPHESGNPTQSHTYISPGVYDILVHVVVPGGASHDVHHQITILAPTVPPEECPLLGSDISSPTKGQVGETLPFYLSLSECLAIRVAVITWDFGDGQTAGSNQDVTHIYSAPGFYPVTVRLYEQNNPTEFLTFVRWVQIVAPTSPTPTPSVSPTATPSPTPPTTQCPTLGQQSTIYSDLYSKDVKCGVDGLKKVTYRDTIVRECKAVNNGQFWVIVSQTPVMQNEGPCEGQSCYVPNESQNMCKSNDPALKNINGKWYIKHGAKKIFYSSQNPKMKCSDVSIERVCNNGVLSNESGPCKNCGKSIAFYIYLECRDGCAADNLSSGTYGSPFFTPNYVETKACVNNGTKEVTYKDQNKKYCVDGKASEVRVKDHILVSEGPCKGQNCIYNGITFKPGESKVFYSTQSPAGTCDSVSQTKTCNGDTGVVSGTTQYTFQACNNGCPNFGPHLSTKTGIVTGEIQEPKVCKYGETGIFDTFQKLVDQSCDAGTVKSKNERKGNLIKVGICPDYKWTPTDLWSVCTANCGGVQTRTYECKSASGATVAVERCVGQAPVETRACDKNPAVKETKDTQTTEEVGSCTACPANQIGIVIGKRVVTERKTMSCVNHAMTVTKTEKLEGPWTYETYCREFTTVRCSHDSLSTSQAEGRYDWMKKCQSTVPVIKEFLTMFEDVVFDSYGNSGGRNSTTLTTSGRRLYPTFMDAANKKPWIAPNNKSASCTVPAKAYVAAVCVSSCATPDQQILAGMKFSSEMKPLRFIDALVAETKYVATVTEDLKRRPLRVDTWITEFIDGEHQILIFQMRSGGQLRVTKNHPLLNANGVMKEAALFKVGDSLVKESGEADAIVAIDQTIHSGKVYNVFLRSDKPEDNVVITNGYLNGTAFFQNEGGSYMNREILRNKLTNGAVK